jgi:hypothetical protein
MQVLQAMNMLTLLLEINHLYSDVVDTSIKTAGPEANPFYNINMKNIHQIIQNQPKISQVTYLKALVPIQLP